MAHELKGGDPSFRADAYPTRKLSPGQALDAGVRFRTDIHAKSNAVRAAKSFSDFLQSFLFAKKHLGN
jgi:hypothetical protein